MEIRTQDGQVMYESEFRASFPDTSFPPQLTAEIIQAFGAAVVLEGPQAQPTRYQIAFRDGIEQIGSQWFTKYSVADLDDEAKAAKDAQQAKSVRQTRDDLLAKSDWTQGKDIADNLSTIWAAYRQELRDIPAQAGFPWEVQFPTQPE
jgi:hypothetical protein